MSEQSVNRSGRRSRKQVIVGVLERRVVNPIMRPVISRLKPKALSLLETTGRRSGEPRVTPVGNGLTDENTFWLVAEHGRHASYVKNMVANPAVRVCVGGQWRDGTAHLVDDDDAMARRRSLDAANGLMGRLDGFFFRTAATNPMSIRIDLN